MFTLFSFKTFAPVAFVAAAVFSFVAPSKAEVVDIKSRGTTVRLLIEGPADAPYVIALYMGGNGAVEIGDGGDIAAGKGNFAVKSRTQFQDLGFATAVVAPAADMSSLLDKRGSAEFAEDFGNVMAYLHERFKKPVWAHGTSRGTISIVLPFSKQKDAAHRPDGIILSSTVTAAMKGHDTVYDGDVGAITGPVLIVAHKNDGCQASPPSGADKLAAKLTNAKPVKVLVVEGNDDMAKGDPCRPASQHGFPGLYKQVIGGMAAFIKNPG